MAHLVSRNPATEEVMATIEQHSDQQLEDFLTDAEKAAARQRREPIEKRAQCMASAADILDRDQDKLAALMTHEMGKTLAAARAEIQKCAWAARYYAENGARFLADRPLQSDASKSYVRHLPLGPVLAVMPWNFPFWQVFRFAAPALVAGNVGLLKHASNVPQTARAIEDVLHEAGFGDGAFQSLMIGSDRVERILKDSRVKAATLTGSEGAGRAVAATAGGEIKKTVLELGGSDPFIVMPSADQEAALNAAITGRVINNGQSCIAAKRFIIHDDIYDDFVGRFADRLDGLSVGDPMYDGTDIGPLAMSGIRDDVACQVEKSVRKGARRVTGA
ncbi:MAG: aldehyde dehydrogenase family protein, partial [Alphaproteobacteria bacterium]|nr:aldehyde dehydrogenase family protein [Alphaproteobacteria bacterium]